MSDNSSLPIVCDLSAVTAADRERLMRAVPALFAAVEAVHELPNGYAFRFASEPGRMMAIAEFVEHDRQCCAFNTYTLEVEPGGGPLWLKMTGSAEVKAFIQTVFSDVQGAVANQLIRPAAGDDLDTVMAATAPVLREVMAKAQ